MDYLLLLGRNILENYLVDINRRADEEGGDRTRVESEAEEE